MWAIILNTLKETYRKKIFAFVAVFTIVYIGVYALLIGFINADMQNSPSNSIMTHYSLSSIVCIIGLYFSTMLTAFLAIMLSIGSISLDIESGIIQTVITKPLKRYKYVLGKYFGICIFIILYSIILYSAVMMIPQFVGIDLIGWCGLKAIFLGIFLFMFEPIVLIAVSIFGSIYFKTLSNGIFLISLYIIGIAGGFAEQIGSLLSNAMAINIGIVSSLISPYDTIYVSYTHLRAHETDSYLVCRLLLEKKKK